MSFWDELEKSEMVIVKTNRLPQDAPAQCATCPTFSTDVMLGVCEACTPKSASGGAPPMTP